MVMDAAAHHHMVAVWLVLLFASAGVFHHAGIKIPFFAFFGHDAGHRVEEAPLNMLIAMGITAFLCVFIGTFPQISLYKILPYPVEYVPYTVPHVTAQTQLLFFSALAFTLLLMAGIYPAEMRALNLDADWFYRRGGRLFYRVMDKVLNGLNKGAEQIFVKKFLVALTGFVKLLPARFFAKICWPFWQTAFEAGDEKTIRENLLKKAQSGFYPIGLIGLFIALYLGFLVLL